MSEESWTGEFRKDALKRIRAYEGFLEACGITAVAGMELEYHFEAINSKFVKPEFIDGFKNSPFVEKLGTEPRPTPRNVAEIVIGAGPRSRAGLYPKVRSPHTIALVMAAAKKNVMEGAADYGMEVSFGAAHGKRVRSLQTSISLWDSTGNTPLFLDIPYAGKKADLFKTNELTVCCAEAMLRAQHALSTLVANNDAAFARQDSKHIDAFGTNYHNKYDSQTLLIRKNTGGTPFKDPNDKTPHAIAPSVYFEDRFPTSESEPALAMLINIGGMAEGLKTYMKAHNLVDEHEDLDPQQFRLHMNSPAFTASPVVLHAAGFEGRGIIDAPWNYALPTPGDSREALAVLRESDLARDIMGEEFYQKFCAACRTHMGRAGEHIR